MTTRTLVSAAVLASMTALPALAQDDNMDKLSNMQRTDATFTHIDQDGDRAEALRSILQHINVPDGFEISLYAVVPDARSMAVAPQGTVTFVGTRKDKVWSVTDRNKDRVADEVEAQGGPIGDCREEKRRYPDNDARGCADA